MERPSGRRKYTPPQTLPSVGVKVNGDLFATISLTSGGDPVITGANGHGLTAEEEETLRTILGYYEDSFVVFVYLLAPIG